MELRESDKYIGKYVIVDLTPEAEKYISDVQVDYRPFGKIENHASMVDVPPGMGKVKFKEHLDRLVGFGLTFSTRAAVAFARFIVLANFEQRALEHAEIAKKMGRIAVEGCAACNEFSRYYIGGDEYGFCRFCGCELSGKGKYALDPDVGAAGYVMWYIPEPACKYFGGEK